MSFLRKLLGVPDPPPAYVGWMRLPSLTVVVFGSLDRTPDLQKIHVSYMERVKSFVPAKEDAYTTDRVGIEKYYSGMVREKLTFAAVPDASETGPNDRVNRLLSIYPGGMYWLLVNEGATVGDDDAALIPLVLTEFVLDPQCALVQGKGHHLFIRPGLVDEGSAQGGSLWDVIEAFGLRCKRVGYLTIDPRSQGRFEP